MCAFEGVYKYMMRGSFSPWGAKVGMGESRLMNFNDAYRHVIGRRAASPCLPPSRNELPRTPPPLVPRSKGGGRSSLNKFRPTAFDSRVIEISIRWIYKPVLHIACTSSTGFRWEEEGRERKLYRTRVYRWRDKITRFRSKRENWTCNLFPNDGNVHFLHKYDNFFFIPSII